MEKIVLPSFYVVLSRKNIWVVEKKYHGGLIRFISVDFFKRIISLKDPKIFMQPIQGVLIEIYQKKMALALH